MHVTATDAKNRLGEMLDHCQREPVVIEKSGRRHGVLLSAAHYDALLAAARRAQPACDDPSDGLSPQARAFRDRHAAWFDDQQRRFDAIGVWNQDVRGW